MRDPKSLFRRAAYEPYCFAQDLRTFRALLDAGARVIQIRNKIIDDLAFRELVEDALAMLSPSDETVVIVNDRVEIAIELNADGVHVGQEDTDYREVIRIAPERMIVGVSARTPELAQQAEKAGADYVGSGAVFPSPTKPDADVIGIDGLRRIVQSVSIPVVAIGGITRENLIEVARTGAQYFAIISDINDSGDIVRSLRQIKRLLTEYYSKTG